MVSPNVAKLYDRVIVAVNVETVYTSSYWPYAESIM